jgi:hypothetical protein
MLLFAREMNKRFYGVSRRRRKGVDKLEVI